MLLTGVLVLSQAVCVLAGEVGGAVTEAGETPSAQQKSRRPPGKIRASRPEGRKKDRSYSPPTQAWKVASLVLGRPSATSISISVFPNQSLEGFVEYRAASVKDGAHSPPMNLVSGNPGVFELSGLQPNKDYIYRLHYRSEPSTGYTAGPEYRFHTQRPPGSRFSFQVQGDSHPERNPKQHLPAMYEQTLLAVAGDRPDFYITIGDDFSIDTLKEVSAQTVEQVYLQHLPYLGLVGHSSPLFLVNGNHEQAARYLLDGTPDNMAVWAQNSRNRLFPQPAPDGFYSGNPQPVEHIGLLRNYYSWTWGDALFVVIDPYWHSEVAVDNRHDGGNKSRAHWQKTLGQEQYHWFRDTLATSSARFKFVFAHHVNGSGRGGVKLADQYEWGGRNSKGQWEFDRMRPGWPLPIHQLMARYGVSVFFQGHDHVYAVEEKDGVIYQTLPEPADPNYALYFEEAYGGTVLPNSGRVRVTVSPDRADIEYVSTVLPVDQGPQKNNNAVMHHYAVKPSPPLEGNPP